MKRDKRVKGDRKMNERDWEESKRTFHHHLNAYIITNLALLAVNLVTMPNQLWFIWPLLGWGVGLLIHWMRVYTGETAKSSVVTASE